MILILKNQTFDIWNTDLEIYAVKLLETVLKIFLWNLNFFLEIKNFILN